MDDFSMYVEDETEYYAYYEQGIKQKDINRIFKNFFNNFNDVLSKYFNEDDYNQVYSELFSELGSLLSKDDNEKNIKCEGGSTLLNTPFRQINYIFSL